MKLIRLWIALVGVVAAVSVYGASDGRVAELRLQGDKAFDAFDNVTALGYYESAWQLDGEDATLLARLTWTCNNVGEDLGSKESEQYFEKAIGYIEALKRLAPDEAQTWFLSAITSGNLGLHRGGKQKVTLSRHVAEDAERCITLDPDYAPGYVTLGVYYREVATLNVILRTIASKLLGGLPAGTLEEAEQMLLKGAEKDPASGYAQYELARTYEAMARPDDAVVHYRKLLELPATDHEIPKFKEAARTRIAALVKQ
jgi:hypothetical protein